MAGLVARLEAVLDLQPMYLFRIKYIFLTADQLKELGDALTHQHTPSEGVLGWYSKVPVCLLLGDEQIEQLELRVEEDVAFSSEPFHD